MSVPKLSAPMSISAIATLAGWEPRRIRRYLKRLQMKTGETLMTPANGPDAEKPRCYYVSLPALRRAAPDMFPETPPDAEDHDERIVTLETRIQQLAQVLGKVNRELSELRARRA